MGIDININDDLVQNTITETINGSSNIYQEYATEFVNILCKYKDSSVNFSFIYQWNYRKWENIGERVCNGIQNDSDFLDFCKCLYDTAVAKELYKCKNNTVIWEAINEFYSDCQFYLADERGIFVSDFDFSMPYEEPDFLVADPIVPENLTETTTAISAEDEEELLNDIQDLMDNQNQESQTENNAPENQEKPETNYGYDLSLNITDAISYFVEATIQSLIADGAANVLSKLGINQDTVEIAQRIIDIGEASLFKINAIIPCIPKNIQMIPSFGASLTSFATSLKDMFMAAWIQVENVYYETINQAITNLPSWEEVQKDAIDEILATGLMLIDQQCIKYTGHTLVELYYMCAPLITAYQQYKESRKQKRELEEEGYEYNEENEADEHHDKDINVNISLNSEELKRALKEDLANASDMIFNAFIIIQIRDAILGVQQTISQFHDVDLRVLVENMNSLQDLMDLLDEIGLNDNSWTVSLAEAIEIGINDFQNQFNGLTRQMAAIGIATGVNMASDVINNVQTNVSIDDVPTAFEFKNNINDMDTDFEITLVIYTDPTLPKVQKNLVKVLRNAEDNNGVKLFDAGQVVNIITQLKDAYSQKKDRDIDLVKFKFKIHFEIEGFNKTLKEDIIEKVTKMLQELEEKRKREKEQAINTFELGVMTEEYTLDPTMAKRRPTIQLVHDLYALLEHFFPILKVFSVLVSNYKINKEKVKNNAKGNIFAMKRVLAKANRLLNYLNTDNKNFYTIRTLKMYDYVDKNIHSLSVNNENRNSNTVEINEDETLKFYGYLRDNNLDNKVLKPDLDTVLYIDNEALAIQRSQMDESVNALTQFFGEDAPLFVNYPETNLKDGTFEGIDKIEVLENEIYYSDSSLPVIGSQIIRAYQQNLDVNI